MDCAFITHLVGSVIKVRIRCHHCDIKGLQFIRIHNNVLKQAHRSQSSAQVSTLCLGLMVDKNKVGTTEEEGLEVGIAVMGGLDVGGDVGFVVKGLFDGFAEVGLFVAGFTVVGLRVVGLGVLGFGFGEGFSDGRRVVGIRVVGLDVGVKETGDGKGPLTRTAI